jgi:Bacterial EndoU nuclease
MERTAGPGKKSSGIVLLLAIAALVITQGLALSRSHRSRSTGAPGSPSTREEWSPTSPPVNVTHIFEGEINRRGKPTGFHSRPGGHDPANARLARIVDRPNRAGVYTAEVEIRSGAGSESTWLGKRSTLYPDRLDRQAVIQAVLNAFRNRQGQGEQFRGPSGLGFTIEGYYQNGRINTAYPIYSRN